MPHRHSPSILVREPCSFTRTKPAASDLSRIIKFLGYSPFPEPVSVTDQLLDYRRRHGLGQRALARLLGVDSSTVTRWEAGKRVIQRRSREPVKRLLAMDVDKL